MIARELCDDCQVPVPGTVGGNGIVPYSFLKKKKKMTKRWIGRTSCCSDQPICAAKSSFCN